MSEIVIRAENLGKKYTIGHQAENGRYVALRDVLVHNAKVLLSKTKDLVKGNPIIQGDTTEEVWALKDINFEIKRGDAVGIIGRNGAGKSTLLKILSRITEPTTGRVTIKGRVASLLEVGTGFHPELTGRENIYLNGTILGMKRAEIKKKFDEIVAFAEIEKYLDTPVKRYSSGMYVRLAFAVAAHLEPEILVVDEVLAVGDAQFQKKCLGKMEDVGKEGRTVLFVSHNMSAIQKLCKHCLLLKNGMLTLAGYSQKVVSSYLNDYSAGKIFKKSKIINSKPSIISATLEQSQTMPDTHMIVFLDIYSGIEKNVSIDLRFADSAGCAVGFGSLGTFSDAQLCPLKKGLQKIVMSFPIANFAVGIYLISIDLTEPDHEYFERNENCLSFEVTRPPTGDTRRVLMQSWGYGAFQLPLNLINHEKLGDRAC